MNINTKQILSISEVNQNFSKATKLASSLGEVYIFKNNRPAYILTDMQENCPIQMSDKEKIEFVGRRILKEHLGAFKELAK